MGTEDCVWLTMTVVLLIVGQVLLILVMVVNGRPTWTTSITGALSFASLLWLGVLYVAMDLNLYTDEDAVIESAITSLVCIIMEGCFFFLFVGYLLLALILHKRKDEAPQFVALDEKNIY